MGLMEDIFELGARCSKAQSANRLDDLDSLGVVTMIGLFRELYADCEVRDQIHYLMGNGTMLPESSIYG